MCLNSSHFNRYKERETFIKKNRFSTLNFISGIELYG